MSRGQNLPSDQTGQSEAYTYGHQLNQCLDAVEQRCPLEGVKIAIKLTVTTEQYVHV